MTEARVDFRSYGSEVGLHRHDHHQIVLPRHGRLDLEIAGRGGAVAPGCGAFILAGAAHAFRATGPNGFVVVDIAVAAGPALDRFDGTGFFALTPPLQSLIDYVATRKAVPPGLAQPWSVLLLDALPGAAASRPDPAQGLFDRAMAFMRRHLDRPIGVADIARAAGASETRLYGLFRGRTGAGPHAALRELRLDAALRLLADTGLSVAEIAIRTGHGDQSGLTRSLRSRRGLTPAAFRRAARGDQAGGA